MNRDGFGPGPAQGPTDLGWAGPAQTGPGPKNFGPNPSIKELVWIWPSPWPKLFGAGPGPAQIGRKILAQTHPYS